MGILYYLYSTLKLKYLMYPSDTKKILFKEYTTFFPPVSTIDRNIVLHYHVYL